MRPLDGVSKPCSLQCFDTNDIHDWVEERHPAHKIQSINPQRFFTREGELQKDPRRHQLTQVHLKKKFFKLVAK